MELRTIAVDAFFARDDVDALLAEYAEECRIQHFPHPRPNKVLYTVLERTGMMTLLAAFDGERMVGFAALLVAENPHYSEVLATTESLFVTRSHREKGYGSRLLREVEMLAGRRGAHALLVSAPAHGQLDQLLTLNSNYSHTNNVHVRVLS